MLLVLTRMNSKAEYLTAIQQDWTVQNLIGLQSILNAAYAKAGEVANSSREPAVWTIKLCSIGLSA